MNPDDPDAEHGGGDNGHAEPPGPLDRLETLLGQIVAKARDAAAAGEPDLDEVLVSVRDLATTLAAETGALDPVARVEAYFGESTPHQRVDDDTVLVHIDLDDTLLSGIAHARRSQDILIFYTVCPQRVPEDRRAEVARFLTMANYGLPVGNFEMDLGDGEVRFKNSVEYGQRPDAVDLDALVIPGVQVMQVYLPGILQVAFEGRDADDVIAALED